MRERVANQVIINKDSFQFNIKRVTVDLIPSDMGKSTIVMIDVNDNIVIIQDDSTRKRIPSSKLPEYFGALFNKVVDNKSNAELISKAQETCFLYLVIGDMVAYILSPEGASFDSLGINRDMADGEIINRAFIGAGAWVEG